MVSNIVNSYEASFLKNTKNGSVTSSPLPQNPLQPTMDCFSKNNEINKDLEPYYESPKKDVDKNSTINSFIEKFKAKNNLSPLALRFHSESQKDSASLSEREKKAASHGEEALKYYNTYVNRVLASLVPSCDGGIRQERRVPALDYLSCSPRLRNSHFRPAAPRVETLALLDKIAKAAKSGWANPRGYNIITNADIENEAVSDYVLPRERVIAAVLKVAELDENDKSESGRVGGGEGAAAHFGNVLSPDGISKKFAKMGSCGFTQVIGGGKENIVSSEEKFERQKGSETKEDINEKIELSNNNKGSQGRSNGNDNKIGVKGEQNVEKTSDKRNTEKLTIPTPASEVDSALTSSRLKKQDENSKCLIQTYKDPMSTDSFVISKKKNKSLESDAACGRSYSPSPISCASRFSAPEVVPLAAAGSEKIISQTPFSPHSSVDLSIKGVSLTKNQGQPKPFQDGCYSTNQHTPRFINEGTGSVDVNDENVFLKSSPCSGTPISVEAKSGKAWEQPPLTSRSNNTERTSQNRLREDTAEKDKPRFVCADREEKISERNNKDSRQIESSAFSFYPTASPTSRKRSMERLAAFRQQQRAASLTSLTKDAPHQTECKKTQNQHAFIRVTADRGAESTTNHRLERVGGVWCPPSLRQCTRTRPWNYGALSGSQKRPLTFAQRCALARSLAERE